MIYYLLFQTAENKERKAPERLTAQTKSCRE